MHNSYIFIQENAFENVVCQMASTLSQPQWVNEAYQYIVISDIFFTCKLSLKK